MSMVMGGDESRIVGVDEVGRGAWAGPLVAAALMITDRVRFPWERVQDSKELGDASRRAIVEALLPTCRIEYGVVSNAMIDRIGIQPANVLAVDIAVRSFLDERCAFHSDYIASFHALSSLPVGVELHVRGEAKYPEIAAASIAAKVFRDDLMRGLHELHPQYLFSTHKGYGTALHRMAVRQYGTSPVHRVSFEFAR